MGALYTIVGTLVALGVLVTFHEFGHFWVARRCGVKVLRFSVGFGTPLCRWHDRHGTEFVIAAIPLGGYVKMLDEREAEVPLALQNQAFNRKTVGERIAIVAAGPIANFLLAIAFFSIIGMLGVQQVRPLIGVVAEGSAAQRAGLQSGQEILAVDGESTSGWAAVNLQLINRLGESGQIDVEVLEADGYSKSLKRIDLDNWLRGATDPDPLGSLGIKPWMPKGAPVVARVLEGSAAELAGLRAGDQLLSIDQVLLESPDELVAQTKRLAGQQVALSYLRDGLQLQTQVSLPNDPAVIERVGYLGVAIGYPPLPEDMLREVSYGPFDALLEGLKKTWSMTVLTLDSLKKMLFGELSVKNLSGPITIAKVAGASAQSGIGDFLNFLAILSISLGVLNLLPIPVLDGGHLLFYVIEWVRGRPLSERVQTWGVQIGISLVVGVMILALFNDIGRL